METQIQKWGKNLGLRIPAKLARQLHLKAGKLVDMKIEGNHLAIYPRKYHLEQMLDSINEANAHSEQFD